MPECGFELDLDSEDEFDIELEKILIWMEYLRLMDDKRVI